ncbi:SYP1 [Candida pseudojiufengensis]|uniref:SYP1 n=1 Tax=Candida pseudojiufengensis TaxID=497109 RepID=UPI0022258E17|nr:SYP1 [Candida pseudojiufengensis]KAI5959397.1 SYP1 [Candida pseudojiufengensis]
MEESYNFATTILTSKSPEQAAAIVPNVITGSTGLNKDLIAWFNQYSSAISSHNQALKSLLEEANKIGKRSNIGFNNFPRNWNCLLNSVQLDLNNNEILQKNLKQEIINPLKDLIEKDVRISELIVNGQELNEISQNLTKDGEYQWNYKAPQTFQNLEDFKKIEIQLMFDIILNYFQLFNGKLTKELKNNENSTNYLLGSFKLDHEMENQLDYLQNTQFQLPKSNFPSSSTGAAGATGNAQPPPKQKRMSSFGRLDKHTSSTGSVGSDSSSPKKQSKLKSRVGSIFGRKKKKDQQNQNQLNHEQAIPEDASLSTETSTTRSAPISRNATRRSTLEPPIGNQRQDSFNSHQNDNSNIGVTALPTQRSPFQPLQPTKKSQQPSQQSAFPEQTQNYSTQQSNFGSSQQHQQQQQSQPITPTHDKFIRSTQDPIDSPNVIKYNDNDEEDDEEDEDESDEDSINNGRRSSLLQRHKLDTNEQTPSQSQSPAIGSFSQSNNKSLPQQPQQYQQQSQQIPQQTSQQQSSQQVPQLFQQPKQSIPASAYLDTHQRSRQSSDGKYSFEVGDDQKPISATPRSEQNGFNIESPSSKQQPIEPVVDTQAGGNGLATTVAAGIAGATGAAAGAVAGALTGISELGNNNSSDSNNNNHNFNESQTSSSLSNKPAPPPSRKVVHHDTTTSTNSTSRDSTIFHNLPSATSSSTNTRDSFIQPPSVISRNSFINNQNFKPLVNQDTGSLLKNDFKHFNLNDDSSNLGLNTSIAEIINANFKDGQLISSQLLGEVAFNYNGNLKNQSPIQINIPYKFDKLIVNKQFFTELGNNQYSIDPLSISKKTLGGLKYLIKNLQVPILIQQIWKFEPHQSSLMISLRSNLPIDIILENLIVSVALDSNVEATSASSKPQGSFNKDKNRITWRYNNLIKLKSNGANEEKLIARFMTNGIGKECESGVQLKFAISNANDVLNSCKIYLNDDESAGGNNEEIPSFRNLISGQYSSHI